MVNKKPSLKDLQKEIAKLRSQTKSASERVLLERELRELRDGQSNNTLKRISRGFRVLVKKGAAATGKGVVKLRKFAIESGATEGLIFKSQEQTISPARRRVISIKKRRPPTTRIIKRITIRRIKTKPLKRRTVRRTRPPRDEGFFGGGLSIGF